LPKLRPQITAIRDQIDLTAVLINERAPVFAVVDTLTGTYDFLDFNTRNLR
jgi:hypothetical protein